MLDLSPISSALTGYQQQMNTNDQLGMAQKRLDMETDRFEQEKKDRTARELGNVTLLTLEEKDPIRRAEKWKRVASSHPDFGAEYQDPETGPIALLAKAGMGQQYLEWQLRKAAEGRANSQLAMSRASHDASMAQYQNMSPANRAKAAPTLGLIPGTNEHRAFIATGQYSPGESMKLNLVPEGSKLVATNPRTAKHEVVAEGNPKPMNLGFNDINKISEEGGKFATINGLANSFNPKYSGYMAGGDTAMAGTRIGIPLASQDAAQWWQTYDRHKNVVRNELFGAALTAPEQAQFDKADITPNMHPDIVKRNLATQEKIIRAAAQRKVEALIAAGAKPEVVQKAYGFDPRASGPSGGAGGANDPLGIR
jgi:hypothetical protein